MTDAIDSTHRYVVTVRSYSDNDVPNRIEVWYNLDAYSAADAVTAVRTWIEARWGQKSYIGGPPPIPPRVVRVEPYDKACHGAWFVEPGGPGRGLS